MSKTFAVVAVALCIAAAGSAEAMTTRSHSLSYKHFPTCAAGLVKATCVCRAANGPRRQVLCPAGRYCHTWDGACTQ
jgi:hypothetical protein